jgi:altronate hydrolase
LTRWRAIPIVDEFEINLKQQLKERCARRADDVGYKRLIARNVPILENQNMQNSVLQLDSRDNVLVALTPLGKGELIPFSGDTYSLLSDVPAKQKFVTRDLQPGDQVIMYGGLVGTATVPIRRGDLLSTRNIRHAASDFHASEETARWTPPDVSAWRGRTFLGYHRADGQVGTRNYWLVIPLVFCENRNLGVLKQAFEEELGFALPQIYRRQVAELVRLYREGKAEELKNFKFAQDKGASTAPKVFRNIDGIKFLAHEQGCGGTREDTRNLCGLLAGYIHHPNVAGATILSLGCQNAQIPTLLEEIKRRDPNFSKPLLVFEQQQIGEESTMLSKAIRETFVGLVEADQAERAPAPLSRLCIIRPLGTPPISLRGLAGAAFCRNFRSCAEWNSS